MKTNLKIGNLVFAEEGISVIIPYNNEEWEPPYTNDEIASAFATAKLAVRKRMECCESALQKNLLKATNVTKDRIAWDGGHFSVPAYRAMQAIERAYDWKDLTALQLNQVIKACYEHRLISIRECQMAIDIALEYLPTKKGV